MCIKVGIPGKPFEICMHCSNTLPIHANFVYTQTWVRDFRCDWACHSGWSGIMCDQVVRDYRVEAVLVCALAILLILLTLCSFLCLSKPKLPDPLETHVVVHKTTMVQFRDPLITSHQLRIKLQ